MHQQFTHPAQYKLLQQINSAGHLWSSNNELKDKIRKSQTAALPVRSIKTSYWLTSFIAHSKKKCNGSQISWNVLLHPINHHT